MPTLAEVRFSSWDHFKSHYREFLPAGFQPEDFVFRGQADVHWKLLPSFTRTFGSGNAEQEIWERQVQILTDFTHEVGLFRAPSGIIPAGIAGELRQFARRIPRLHTTRLRKMGGKPTKAETFLKNCIKIWAHGQHYGLPTPLLDWTSSPYVAAFFAYESAFRQRMAWSSKEVRASKDHVAVFALLQKGITGDEWDKMGVLFLTDLENTENTRIKNQRGLFTLLPPSYLTLDDCVIEYCKINSVPVKSLLVKFGLPYSSAISAIRDLELMDINARRIYDDWGGVCSSANMRSLLSFHNT
jgi:FRG domain